MNHFRQYNYFSEQFSEESHLILLAKSGNVNAFVKIYDLYVCEIYRYLYFFLPNNQITEGITHKVFLRAWEQIHQYRFQDTSFITWLYSIAKNQLTEYNHTYPRAITKPPISSLSQTQIKDAKSIRDVLHALSLEEQQMLVFKYIVDISNKEIAYIFRKRQERIQNLQIIALFAFTKYIGYANLKNPSSQPHSIFDDCLVRIYAEIDTIDTCLRRYPTHASILKPLLETALELSQYSQVEPAHSFYACTRDSLSRYLQFQPRPQSPPRLIQSKLPNKAVMQQITRAVLAGFVLAFSLLGTGTAQAQSAMPGDDLYEWKRTSENVWLKVAPEPVAVKLILAERRLDEFIAVSEDSSQNTVALVEYQKAVENLTSEYDEESLTLILPELQNQQEILEEEGYSSPVLDEVVTVVTLAVQSDVVENSNTEIASTDIIETNQEENSVSVTCEPNCETNIDETLSNNTSEETSSNSNENNNDVTNTTDDNANNIGNQNNNDNSGGDEIGEEVGNVNEINDKVGTGEGDEINLEISSDEGNEIGEEVGNGVEFNEEVSDDEGDEIIEEDSNVNEEDNDDGDELGEEDGNDNGNTDDEDNGPR